MAKYESTYFNFGDQEWNISIYPMGDGTNESRRPLIQLNRLSGSSAICALVVYHLPDVKVISLEIGIRLDRPWRGAILPIPIFPHCSWSDTSRKIALMKTRHKRSHLYRNLRMEEQLILKFFFIEAERTSVWSRKTTNQRGYNAKPIRSLNYFSPQALITFVKWSIEIGWEKTRKNTTPERRSGISIAPVCPKATKFGAGPFMTLSFH